MAREIKDELLPEDIEGLETIKNSPENSLQIPLSEEQEKELCDIVLQDFQAAEEARKTVGVESWGMNYKGEDKDWEGKYELLLKRYEGFTEPPLKPWMSSGTTKICTAIVELLHSKIFPAVWNENLIGWKPVEITDKGTVERINKLMTWVVRVQMKLRREVDDIVKYVVKLGSCIVKDSWDKQVKDIGKTEPIMTVDPMGQPVQVNGEDGQPLTQKVLDVKEKAKIEIRPLDRFYIQPGCTDLQKEPVIDRISYLYSDLEKMELQGRFFNIEAKVKPEVDTIITSKLDKVLEEAERVAITNVKRRNHPLDVLEWYGNYDYDGDGFSEDVVACVTKETKTLISAIPLHKISKRGIRPFTKHGLIRRETKFYDIGMIELCLPLAEEVDACLRQIRDANTLSVLRFGFYDANGDYDAETHTIAPLKMYPVSDPQRSVYFPDISVPTERLTMCMRLIMEFIERLTAASSYVMGRESELAGGSGTATRTQAVISNAEQRFDIPAQRLRDTIAELLTHVLCQYQLNIPPGFEREILGEKGEPIFEPGSLTSERIASELDAYLDGDPAMGNKNTQREIASFIYSSLLQNPLVATDPSKIYKVTAILLKSVNEEPTEILGPEPNMLDMDSPEQENTLIREGRFKDVVPHIAENHLEHIQVHSLPMVTSEQSLWNPLALQYLQGHIQQHQQLMMQMMQITQQAQAKGMGQGNMGQNPNAPAGTNASGTPNPMQNPPGMNPNQQTGQTL